MSTLGTAPETPGGLATPGRSWPPRVSAAGRTGRSGQRGHPPAASCLVDWLATGPPEPAALDHAAVELPRGLLPDPAGGHERHAATAHHQSNDHAQQYGKHPIPPWTVPPIALHQSRRRGPSRGYGAGDNEPVAAGQPGGIGLG